MSFKKVEINGFKSFADRIEIKFTNGVTGIVGPNGCGKSNVADAIRFCLGEGSSKSLRGGKMNDVIFAGTDKRKSLSYCEVSMYFNNKNKIFKDLEYDEVVFTRKLFRDDESEYYINKTLCRKADILDALRDSGVGKEGYSIIGQGKVEELISSKPVDRRAIFDEAAGISKFKHRKIDSQRKIARAQDSLARINDMLNYTSEQLKPLIKDAEKARKYLDTFEKLRHYEINIYLHQFETTNETKAIIEERKRIIVDSISKTQNKLNIAVEKYDKAINESRQIDDTLQDLNNKLLAASISKQENAGQISSLRQSIGYIEDQINKLSTEIKTFKGDILSVENSIKDTLAQIDKAKDLLEKNKQNLAQKQDEQQAIMDKISNIEGAERESRLAVENAMKQLADIKANMSTLIANKTNYLTSIDASRNKILEYKQNLDNAQNELSSKEEEYNRTIVNKAKSDEKYNSLTAELDEKQKKLALSNTSYKETMDAYQKCFAFVEFYEKMIANNSDFENSVASLLNARKRNPEIAKRMEGVVAKLLIVPKKYEIAIETALGSAIQNIVTPTSEDASYLIDYLKTNKLGRATFLPMSDIRSREVFGDFGNVLNHPSCYGIASELVEYDEKYYNIVSNLLAGTLIVENKDIGLEIARKTRYSFKIVTLDGDIIHQRGSMTGGSRSSDKSTFFSNEREYRENKEKLDKLTVKKDGLEAERKLLDNIISNLTLEIRETGKTQQQLSVSEASLKLLVDRTKADIESFTTQIEFEQTDMEDKINKVNDITEKLNSVTDLENTINSSNKNAGLTSSENESLIEALKANQNDITEEITNIKVTIKELETSLGHLDYERERENSEIIAINNKIVWNNNQIEINKSDLEIKKQELQRLLVDSTKDSGNDSVDNLRTQIEQFGSYKKELNALINNLNDERNECTSQLNELGDKKTNEELMLQKVDTDLEQMTDRVTNAYALDYESCKEFRDDAFEADSWIAEAEKYRRIIERLGEVHIDAIERLETTNKEYTELERQHDDVIKAIRSEERIIDTLSKEMKVIFDDQFAKINANFKKTFKELFNGGTANLIINPLEEGQTDELDAGIEIVAQPPSKALQRLSLLSGGEKALTAIAILFAILQLRPMPFCILDEIEAALDDANALRFAKYLKRFSNETQFIVITHRKPTMELCDSLYGVTMEEKGVTKLVSVSLSDATKFVE